MAKRAQGAKKPEAKRTVAPPSVLPDISPSRGEIKPPASASQTGKDSEKVKVVASKLPISPLEGEMSGRTEGGGAKSDKSASEISADTDRRPALAGREASATGVSISILPPAERISLRAPEASRAALSKALGLALPQEPKTSTSKGKRVALWLGPDEWLVIDEAGKDPLADCAKVEALHSAVGISHRNVAIEVAGPAAEATLNAGCPQDLSLTVFPVGACSRTVLGKADIVLYRTARDAFRVECWRSFSDYVFTFLQEAMRDAAA